MKLSQLQMQNFEFAGRRTYITLWALLIWVPERVKEADEWLEKLDYPSG
jgi:hypothetical protein